MKLDEYKLYIKINCRARREIYNFVAEDFIIWDHLGGLNIHYKISYLLLQNL